MKITDSNYLMTLAKKAAGKYARLLYNRSVEYDYVPGYSYTDYQQEALCELLKININRTYTERQIIDYMFQKLEWHFDTLHKINYRVFNGGDNYRMIPTKTSEVSSVGKKPMDFIDYTGYIAKEKPEPTIRSKIAAWVVESCLPTDPQDREVFINLITSYDLVDLNPRKLVRVNGDCAWKQMVHFLHRVKNFIERSGGYDNLFGDKHTEDADLEALYERLCQHDIHAYKTSAGYKQQYLPRTFCGLYPDIKVNPPRKSPSKPRRFTNRNSRIGFDRYQRDHNNRLKIVTRNKISYRIMADGTLEDIRIKYHLIDGKRYRTLLDGTTEAVLD